MSVLTIDAILNLSGTGNSLSAEDTLPTGAQNAVPNSIPDRVSAAEAMHVDTHNDSMTHQFSSTAAMAEEMDINPVTVTGENSAGNRSSHAVSNFVEGQNDTISVIRQNFVATQCSPAVQNVEDTNRDRIPIIRENAPVNGSSSSVTNIEDVHMVEANDHPFILPGDIEIPFTYLANLSAKWAAMKGKAPSVQGKIKVYTVYCFFFDRELYPLSMPQY